MVQNLEKTKKKIIVDKDVERLLSARVSYIDILSEEELTNLCIEFENAGFIKQIQDEKSQEQSVWVVAEKGEQFANQIKNIENKQWKLTIKISCLDDSCKEKFNLQKEFVKLLKEKERLYSKIKLQLDEKRVNKESLQQNMTEQNKVESSYQKRLIENIFADSYVIELLKTQKYNNEYFEVRDLCNLFEDAGLASKELNKKDTFFRCEYSATPQCKEMALKLKTLNEKLEKIEEVHHSTLLYETYYAYRHKKLSLAKIELTKNLDAMLNDAKELQIGTLVEVDKNLYATSDVKKMCELRELQLNEESFEELSNLSYCKIRTTKVKGNTASVAKETDLGKIFLRTYESKSSKESEFK